VRKKIEMRKETRARKIPKACVGDERCLKALDRTAILVWVIVGKTERRRPVKGSRSEPDADEDRNEGVDEGGEDNEGPWGRRKRY